MMVVQVQVAKLQSQQISMKEKTIFKEEEEEVDVHNEEIGEED